MIGEVNGTRATAAVVEEWEGDNECLDMGVVMRQLNSPQPNLSCSGRKDDRTVNSVDSQDTADSSIAVQCVEEGVRASQCRRAESES